MKITVIGGGGHVGLPLSIALANANDEFEVTIYDINTAVIEKINQGIMPFNDRGADKILKQVIGKNLNATDNLQSLARAEALIFAFSTHLDEKQRANFDIFQDFIEKALPYLNNNQTILLRSTVYPGTTAQIQDILKSHGLNIEVAFCPERIAQGEAINELHALPQIISAFGDRALLVAKKIFSQLTATIIELEPSEAELAKLFTNSWRYIQFATANQFYMLAQEKGIDFHRVFDALRFEYPRADGFAKPGFAAGPCLYKDTLHLAAYSGQSDFLGNTALKINQGLPEFVVRQIEQDHNLAETTVGILGMAFKANSDDKRDSLSYILRKALEPKAKRVLCTDTFISDEEFVTLDKVLTEADILILATPHKAYQNLKIEKPIYDVWGFYKKK